MHNVATELQDGKLIITIDVNGAAQSAPPSRSGKSRLVASSGGLQNVAIPHLPGFKLAVNATIPA